MWIRRRTIRKISTPKLICRNLPSLLGVRLHSFPWTQIVRMMIARSWLLWMRCRLTRFALTRMHLRLQVKERHELRLLRPRLLRRKLLRLPAEEGEEDDRAPEARNAPRRRASQARPASPATEPQRRNVSRITNTRELCTMGKFHFHFVCSDIHSQPD